MDLVHKHTFVVQILIISIITFCNINHSPHRSISSNQVMSMRMFAIILVVSQYNILCKQQNMLSPLGFIIKSANYVVQIFKNMFWNEYDSSISVAVHTLVFSQNVNVTGQVLNVHS